MAHLSIAIFQLSQVPWLILPYIWKNKKCSKPPTSYKYVVLMFPTSFARPCGATFVSMPRSGDALDAFAAPTRNVHPGGPCLGGQNN